ncbi:MAG: trigger factor [Parasphingorhabdus sp.]|jgi:trigger factor
MQVSLENTGSIGRKMTITIPAEQLEGKVDERFKTMGRTVRLPGFRPGKAPRKVLESQFGPQVVMEVAEKLINDSYREALGSQEIMPASAPRIQPKQIERGQDLEFIAEFEVYPEIKKIDLSGETVTRPVCEVGDADIQKTIDSLRKRQVNWAETEDAAADGDQLMIDFIGTIDAEEFEGGSAEDFAVELGAGGMLADFEAGLTGAKAADTKTVEVNFPEDYPGAAVAGKTAKFEISVKKVSHPELPEVNEEFIKTLGVAESTLEGLQGEVRKNLERELADRIRANVKNQVMEHLVRLNDIELPSQMIEEEVKRSIEATQAQFKQQGIDMPVDRERVEPESRRRVALGLILHDIVRTNEIKLDEDKLRSRVEEQASSYEKPEEFVRWHYADRSRLSEMEAAIMEEQVVDFLVNTATTEEKPMQFEEFVNQAA